MARPSALNPLFRSVRTLKGVGPRLMALLTRFFGGGEGRDPIVLDLLMHMPANVIDRRRLVGAADAAIGETVTLNVHIDRHQPPPRGRSNLPYRVMAHDETGDLQIVFFHAKGEWVARALPVGERRYVSGEIGWFGREKQMAHPDYMVAEDQFSSLPLVEPVYPATQGLSSKALHKLMLQAVETVPALPEWVPLKRMAGQDWPGFSGALKAMHTPQTPQQAQLTGPARQRLAYDEYLAGQLALLIVRSQLIQHRGEPRQLTGEMTGAVRAALPFSLTQGQEQAIEDISTDLAGENRMARLLQGDVGAGKTVVALMGMAAVVEGGAQSAFMAPTELLAAQHLRTMAPLCENAGISIALLTGKMPASERRATLGALAAGELDIIVGTHALFQSDVAFANLGLVVVDEQHRFGVHQRLALSDKGKRADLLVMTATPIPRTLVLTHFGDMDVSVLKQKPAGRLPIETAAVPVSKYERVIERLRVRLAEGAQAFWVCPLVEESEALDLVSAQDRHAALRAQFGDQVGLVHGRMKGSEKDAVMQAFQAGTLKLLVATTVIEVGVDVPQATIMIIEHAERFGLAQLHQLRGRVGRGDQKSACLLLHAEQIGQTARERLKVMTETEDGFVIAEKDLQLRGQGDVLGTRQSGMPGYRLAIPDVHRHLLPLAHEDAIELLAANPGLTGPRGDAARTLLYLFRKELALPLIKSG